MAHKNLERAVVGRRISYVEVAVDREGRVADVLDTDNHYGVAATDNLLRLVVQQLPPHALLQVGERCAVGSLGGVRFP